MEFRLLGPLEVLGDDGAPVALGGSRPRALLALLLLHPNQAVSTDRLIDAIWGESPPASARGALQVHVHALRKALGADRIRTHAPGYLVRVEPGELDAARFEELVDRGCFAEALALWHGPALADLAGEDFARADAARLDEARLSALEARIAADLDAGRHDSVAAELEGLVATHPHRDRLRAEQMLALYRAGRQTDALAAYRDARAALDELGLEPSAELRELEQQILRQDPSLSRAADEPAAPNVLPEEPTPLVGRDLELAAVTGLLRRPETRLVTLTGSGGTGKTRLAVAAARTASAERGRTVFVDLSSVTDPRLVLPTIGRAVGSAEALGAGEIETVAAALGAEPPLLVLDNLEQVLDAAADVAGLLAAAPKLRAIATSRAPLRIAAEHVYVVPALPVPEAGAEDVATIEHVAAVRLYADRARAHLPGFEVADGNAAAVARICRALDGLPLALELAAARVRTLGPEGTAARLGERLSLLSRGARDLPERQRSLRATLDWSAQLLDDRPRRLLGVLAVFSGGASLEALEAVAGEGDVAASLEDLLDAALATRAAASADEPHFSMLETVREYATELLIASGEEREVRDRHLGWCLAQVEGEGPYWQRTMDATWLDRIGAEHGNMRAAFAHAEAVRDVERELRLATGLRYFWRVRGYVEEGRRRLERGVELAGGAAPELRARVLAEAGVMAFAAHDYERSLELWTEALPLFEQVGNRREIGRALGELGTGRHALGDLERALGYYESARVVFSQVDDPHSLAVILANVGAIHHTFGDLEQAHAATTEALRLQQELGDDDGITVTTLNLASLELALGDVPGAARHARASLERSLVLSYRELTAYALGIAAEIALKEGRPEDAGILSGAFLAQFRVIGSEPQAEEADRHEVTLAGIGTEIDVEDMLERGEALALDEAAALAEAVLSAAAR